MTTRRTRLRNCVSEKDVVSDSNAVENFRILAPSPSMFVKLCRLCGVKDGPFFNIFAAEQVINKVQALMPFLIQEDDNLPHKICYRCSAKVEELHDFIQKCISTQKELRVVLGIKGVDKLKPNASAVWHEKINCPENREECDAVVEKAMEYRKETDPGPSTDFKAPSRSMPKTMKLKHNAKKDLLRMKLVVRRCDEDPNLMNLISNNKEALTTSEVPPLLLTTASSGNQDQASKLSWKTPATQTIKKITLGTKKTKSDQNIKAAKATVSETKLNNVNKNIEIAKNEYEDKNGEKIIDDEEQNFPQEVLPHLGKVIIRNFGKMYSCKICNRNFLSKERILLHECFRNIINASKNSITAANQSVIKETCANPPATSMVGAYKHGENSSIRVMKQKPGPKSKKKVEQPVTKENECVDFVPHIQLRSSTRSNDMGKSIDNTEFSGTAKEQFNKRTVRNQKSDEIQAPSDISQRLHATNVGGSPKRKSRRGKSVQRKKKTFEVTSPMIEPETEFFSVDIGLNSTSQPAYEKKAHSETSPELPNVNGRDGSAMKSIKRKKSVAKGRSTFEEISPTLDTVTVNIEQSSKSQPYHEDRTESTELLEPLSGSGRAKKKNKRSKSVGRKKSNSLETPRFSQSIIEPVSIDIGESSKSQPYPVGLFQSVHHCSTEDIPQGEASYRPFSPVKNQSYSILPTDNPNKLLISAKPRCEQPPKKRARTQSLSYFVYTDDTSNVSFDDESSNINLHYDDSDD